MSNAPLDAVSEDRARTIVVLEGALGTEGVGDGLVSCELGPLGSLGTLIGGEYVLEAVAEKVYSAIDVS